MAANKVFIVEDDAVIARAVAAHLTTWQMQVQCAGNFEKITEEVEDFQPDIIIMDIKLPYYNGFYWCAEIRKTSKVPIVFLSSADDNMNTLFRETYHSVTSRFFSNNTCWKLIFAIHFISPTRLNKILFFYCIIMHYPV